MVRPLLVLASAGLLTSCFGAPKTVETSVHHPLADPSPVLNDVCASGTVGTFKVSCDGQRLNGTGTNGPWTVTVDPRDLQVGELFGRYLVATATVEGTFSFLRTTIVDVRNGAVLLDNDGLLIHADPNRQVLLFIPTGPAVGRATFSPSIYKLDLKSGHLDIQHYTVRPRPSCGQDEDDITPARVDQDAYTSGAQLVFPRQDLCGEFDFTVPLP